MTEHVLSYMVFIPLAGMLVVLCLPSDRHDLIRWVSAAATVPPLLLGIWLYANFDTTTTAMQFVERAPWIPAFNIEYYVGVDGLSVSMLLLTALLSFLCIFASWGIDKGVKGYFALFLLLDTGMTGVFVALDFVLFYVFWEVMLLPMYFLIGIWGGPRKEYAAIKFFLYTLLGSVLMLVAILALYFYSEPNTFDMTKLMDRSSLYGTEPLAMWPFNVWGWGFQHVVWMALFIGFAIKIPAFPFHTWLPDAHVEAPTAISVILAGILPQDGHVRIILRNQLPDAAGGHRRPGVLVPGGTGGVEHRLRRTLRHGADRHEEAGSLLQRQPHGLRDAGDGGLQLPGHQRRGAADVQPRHHHRHALPARGSDLRPRPSPRDQRLRRPCRHHAGVRRLHGAGLLRLHGAPGALGFRLRGAGAAGGLAQVPCP